MARRVAYYGSSIGDHMRVYFSVLFSHFSEALRTPYSSKHFLTDAIFIAGNFQLWEF